MRKLKFKETEWHSPYHIASSGARIQNQVYLAHKYLFFQLHEPICQMDLGFKGLCSGIKSSMKFSLSFTYFMSSSFKERKCYNVL